MKKYALYIVTLVIMAAVISSSYYYIGKDSENHAVRQKPHIEINLVGKYCYSLKKIIPPKEIKSANIVILLYNGHDCGSCVEEGFSIARTIDNKAGYQKVFIIGLMTNQGHEQKVFDYPNYIFSDTLDYIRKELKYTPTPLMFLLDTTDMIKKIIFPGNVGAIEREQFIHEVLKFN